MRQTTEARRMPMKPNELRPEVVSNTLAGSYPLDRIIDHAKPLCGWGLAVHTQYHTAAGEERHLPMDSSVAASLFPGTSRIDEFRATECTLIVACDPHIAETRS